MTAPQPTLPVPEKIPSAKLGDTLAKVFPKHYIDVERGMFNSLGRICPDYNGGLWHGYIDPHHTIFYMVPPAGTYHLRVEGNFYEGTLDAEATGIVVSLMVLNALVWLSRDPDHNDLFHNLRTFALEHPDAGEIMKAID